MLCTCLRNCKFCKWQTRIQSRQTKGSLGSQTSCRLIIHYTHYQNCLFLGEMNFRNYQVESSQWSSPVETLSFNIVIVSCLHQWHQLKFPWWFTSKGSYTEICINDIRTKRKFVSMSCLYRESIKTLKFIFQWVHGTCIYNTLRYFIQA